MFSETFRRVGVTLIMAVLIIGPIAAVHSGYISPLDETLSSATQQLIAAPCPYCPPHPHSSAA